MTLGKLLRKLRDVGDKFNTYEIPLECICGPLNWEDAQLLHIITEKYLRELDERIEAFPSSSQEVFEEILRRYKEIKK